MQVNFLKTVAASIVGNSASAVIDLLHGKKNVNEFLIAKKLKLTINQTRNVLYKLSDEGLVSFARKKDSKKGGWYTYFWTLNPGKGLAKYKLLLAREMNDLKNKADVKRNSKFFICRNCHFEFDEEHALNHSYLCPECGEVLEVKDTSIEVAAIDKEVAKIKAILQKVDFEISLIYLENEKFKIKRMKLEDKKKKKEREERKKIRNLEKKKMGNLSKKAVKPKKSKVKKKK